MANSIPSKDEQLIQLFKDILQELKEIRKNQLRGLTLPQSPQFPSPLTIYKDTFKYTSTCSVCGVSFIPGTALGYHCQRIDCPSSNRIDCTSSKTTSGGSTNDSALS